MAGRLSVFAHKQRTNQWFETSPKLATMLKLVTYKAHRATGSHIRIVLFSRLFAGQSCGI
jgi:hypothetical protein